MQAAYYCHLWWLNTGERVPWVWIVVESEPPHATAVYRASELVLRRGERIFKQRLRTFDEALRTGNWHGYSPCVENLELPPWAEKAEGM